MVKLKVMLKDASIPANNRYKLQTDWKPKGSFSSTNNVLSDGVVSYGIKAVGEVGGESQLLLQRDRFPACVPRLPEQEKGRAGRGRRCAGVVGLKYDASFNVIKV